MNENNLSGEVLETIRWGIGLILVGLGSIGVYLWRLATKLTSHDKDIEGMKVDISDIKDVQKEHEVKHNEIIDKIDESSKYLANEFKKSSDNMREYFDKKYTILDARIYELKK